MAKKHSLAVCNLYYYYFPIKYEFTFSGLFPFVNASYLYYPVLKGNANVVGCVGKLALIIKVLPIFFAFALDLSQVDILLILFNTVNF